VSGLRRALVTCAVAAVLCVGAGTARSDGDASGTAAASFLSVGAGAGVLSMGGATLASGRDLASASWNVASLARLDALQFSLSHAPLPGGASQDWLAAGGLGPGGTRWGLQALFHREGDLEGRDAADNPTGSIAVSDVAVGARLAHSLGSYVTAGAGAEWVHESLAGVNGAGVSFEAGLRADAGPVGVALAARHLGGGMHYAGATYDMPAVIAAGVSWTDALRGLRIDADYEAPSHYYNTVRVGGEWRWHDRVALRTGYRMALAAPSDVSTSGLAFGMGAGVGSMWLDYSFLPGASETSGEHRLGLTFRPGGWGLGGLAQRDHDTPERAATPRVAEPSPRVAAPAGTSAASKPAVTPPPASAPPARPAAPQAKPAPSPEPSAPAPPPASMPVVRPASVVVGAGETLAMIARRWDTTVVALMEANDLVNDYVLAGQRLKLPPARTTR